MNIKERIYQNCNMLSNYIYENASLVATTSQFADYYSRNLTYVFHNCIIKCTGNV